MATLANNVSDEANLHWMVRTILILGVVCTLQACQRGSESASRDQEAPQETPRQTQRSPDGVTARRILNAEAEPQSWMTHGRNYSEQRFSPLDEISVQNVASLGLAWYVDLDTNRGQKATPIIVDGTMYVSTAWSRVKAYDAATGSKLWAFDPEVPGEWAVQACCDIVNRGVAVWGNRVFVGALDGRLIALDAQTGREIWSVNTIDQNRPYTITGAPRVVKGKVLIGNGGAGNGSPWNHLHRSNGEGDNLYHVFERIADHPINRINELLPWRVADQLPVLVVKKNRLPSYWHASTPPSQPHTTTKTTSTKSTVDRNARLVSAYAY